MNCQMGISYFFSLISYTVFTHVRSTDTLPQLRYVSLDPRGSRVLHKNKAAYSPGPLTGYRKGPPGRPRASLRNAK